MGSASSTHGYAGPYHVGHIKDSAKGLYLTVPQRARYRAEIIKESLSDRAEMFKDSLSDTTEELQDSWRIITQWLRFIKFLKGLTDFRCEGVTMETVMVLILAVGGTSLLMSLVNWQRARYKLGKKRQRKAKQRLQNIDKLREKLEASKVGTTMSALREIVESDTVSLQTSLTSYPYSPLLLF